jgi:hypothetical protein
MTLYSIELHGAELDVVKSHLEAISFALGRVVEPKPVKAAARPAAVKRPMFPKPPRLPKGSPIGTWLEVDGLGECQVVCQGHAPGEYGVTNGKTTAMVKLREGAVMSVRIFA